MRSTTACNCGLLAAVTALLTPVLGAGFAATPYSHVAQYISELGARGTPHGAVVSIAGFGATGVLVAVFLWSARPRAFSCSLRRFAHRPTGAARRLRRRWRRSWLR